MHCRSCSCRLISSSPHRSVNWHAAFQAPQCPLDEAREGRVVPAGIVEHLPEIGHVAVLPGIGILRRRRAAGVTDLSPRLVPHLRYLRRAARGRDAGAAQLVGEQVIQAASTAHRYSIGSGRGNDSTIVDGTRWQLSLKDDAGATLTTRGPVP